MLVPYLLRPCVRLSVRPPVCLSQVGVLLKRLNVGLHKQRRTIALECAHLWCQCPEPDSGITETFGCIRPVVPTAHSPHPVYSPCQ